MSATSYKLRFALTFFRYSLTRIPVKFWVIEIYQIMKVQKSQTNLILLQYSKSKLINKCIIKLMSRKTFRNNIYLYGFNRFSFVLSFRNSIPKYRRKINYSNCYLKGCEGRAVYRIEWRKQ
jgi:hypothetical protein